MWRQLDSAVSNCMGIDQHLHSTLYGSVLKLWIVQIYWHQMFFSQIHLLLVYKYCRNETRYLVAICIPTGFILFIFGTFTQLREITHTQEIMSALADIGSLADWPVTVIDLLICLKMAPLWKPPSTSANSRPQGGALCCVARCQMSGAEVAKAGQRRAKKRIYQELPSGSLW